MSIPIVSPGSNGCGTSGRSVFTARVDFVAGGILSLTIVQDDTGINGAFEFLDMRATHGAPVAAIRAGVAFQCFRESASYSLFACRSFTSRLAAKRKGHQIASAPDGSYPIRS